MPVGPAKAISPKKKPVAPTGKAPTPSRPSSPSPPSAKKSVKKTILKKAVSTPASASDVAPPSPTKAAGSGASKVSPTPKKIVAPAPAAPLAPKPPSPKSSNSIPSASTAPSSAPSPPKPKAPAKAAPKKAAPKKSAVTGSSPPVSPSPQTASEREESPSPSAEVEYLDLAPVPDPTQKPAPKPASKSVTKPSPKQAEIQRKPIESPPVIKKTLAMVEGQGAGVSSPPEDSVFIAEIPAQLFSVLTTEHETVDEPESLNATGLNPTTGEHTIRFEGLKRTLEQFYSAVAPERAGKAGDVAAKYLGDELRLFAQLETKYRFGAAEKEKRLNFTDRAQKGVTAISTPPVYPPGYLQKEFNKNITAVAIAHACRDQLIANKMKEFRLIVNRAKAAAASAAEKNLPSPPPPPKQKSKDQLSREVEGLVKGMTVDMQVAEMVRLAQQPLEKATTATAQSLYGLSVWADVAVRTHALIKAEKEWDDRVREYLKMKTEDNVGSVPSSSSLMDELHSSSSLIVPAVSPFSKFGVDPLLLDETESATRSEKIPASGSAVGPSAVSTANDVLGFGVDKNTLINVPSLAHGQEALLWQLVHEHHQRVRRSLFNGEVIVDETLPTGEAAVKAAVNAPLTVPATVLRACIGSGYASTCDVTYRQQLQALVMKYCPLNAPLVMPALWLYRGREHELIARLHSEYGLDKPPSGEPSSTRQRPISPPPIGNKDFILTAPNTLNSFPDPLVGSEVYLCEVMHGAVCGISREVEYDTRFKLMKDGTTKGPNGKGGTLPAVSSLGSVPPCAYPCEDASFRSWSNVPPSLHATAHMARHFGLGPQFVHQLHAQNPLNPDACGFELLCSIFPDAVYFCLDDDEQRLAFMARRVSELMSFVQLCDPTFTRPHRGLPDGNSGGDASSQVPLIEAIPRLFQKYTGLKDTPTDEQVERQVELDRMAVNTANKFLKKPSKVFKGFDGDSAVASADDEDDDDEENFYGGAAYRYGRDGTIRNRPERALADVFAQHFGKQLQAAEQPAFPWEDMYKHINKERHQQVLDSCLKWSKAYGPLPPLSAIQLDIIGAATAVALSSNGDPDVSEPLPASGSTSQGASQRFGALKPAQSDFPESSGTTRHVPATLLDPRNPTLSLLGVPTAAMTPSLLHQMACKPLTRSTPVVHDSILKPWLRNTCEVGTMTRHKEEEIMQKMLNTRSVGTCVDEDDIDLSDDKYQGWPVPFRYQEEYRQAVAKMSLPQLRRERHRALFGGRSDPGVVLFGNKGRPMPHQSNPQISGSHSQASFRYIDPTNAQPHRSNFPTLGRGGGGVRFAADGSIDLSSSPSPSRSPYRNVNGHNERTKQMAKLPPQPIPSASDVSAFYKFQKDYEQWFEENIGESGRGRFNYKKQRDPDREARRAHLRAYFGVIGISSSSSDDENNNGTDDALFDEVFGEGRRPPRTMITPSADGLGPASRALAEAQQWGKSPYWFDNPRWASDYFDESDVGLASKTPTEAIPRLIRRFRYDQHRLEEAGKEIDKLREEVAILRDAASGNALHVPRLAGSEGRHEDRPLRDLIGYRRTGHPKAFASAVLANDSRGGLGDVHCSNCEILQSRVNTLLERLSTLRSTCGGDSAAAYREAVKIADKRAQQKRPTPEFIDIRSASSAHPLGVSSPVEATFLERGDGSLSPLLTEQDIFDLL